MSNNLRKKWGSNVKKKASKKTIKKAKKVRIVHETKSYILFDTLEEAIDFANKQGISNDDLEVVTIAFPPDYKAMMREHKRKRNEAD